MEDMVRATLIANAGLLLEYRGVKLLADAICRAADSFSGPPPAVWSAMLAGEPPFDRIDALLFTHDHPDHLSPERLTEYLRRRPVKQVLLPPVEARHLELLQPFLEERGIRRLLLTPEMHMADFRLLSGISVRPYFTRHIDRAFWNVPHCCYLLSFGEKRVLLTADADYTQETFQPVASVPLKAVFVNPLFFNALQARRFFKGTLNPDILCVYHVPFPQDDLRRIRPELARNVCRWDLKRGRTAVLCDPYQRIEF